MPYTKSDNANIETKSVYQQVHVTGRSQTGREINTYKA